MVYVRNVEKTLDNKIMYDIIIQPKYETWFHIWAEFETGVRINTAKALKKLIRFLLGGIL